MSLSTKASLWLAAALAALGIWFVASDWVFLFFLGRTDLFAWPYTAWYQSLPWWRHSVNVKLSLAGGAIVPIGAMTLVATIARNSLRAVRVRRRVKSGSGKKGQIQRGSSDNHGHADFLPMEEAFERFPGPSRDYGGVVVGEAHRPDLDDAAVGKFVPGDKSTWGRGGKNRLLIDPCIEGSTHSLVFSGSGGFKTTSAIPTIFTWHGSSVVHDPSREVGKMVEDSLRQSGKRVIFLDPVRPASAVTWGFNALDWIDINAPMAEAHVGTVVSWLFDDDPVGANQKDMFFRSEGKNLVECLLMHLLWSRVPTEDKTLMALRAGITLSPDEMMELLEAISIVSESYTARQNARRYVGMTPETFHGIHANANNGTRWLGMPEFAELISGDAFRTNEITNGRTTVFIQIPVASLLVYPGVARVCVGALMNAVYETQQTGRVLFLLDEASLLGRLKIIETARDVGRKSGITMHLMFQSVGQMEEQWGRAQTKAWHEGVSWIRYSGIQDWAVAKELSDSIGTHAVLAWSEGDNVGRSSSLKSWATRSRGWNVNTHEISHHLLPAPEILQDLRTDEALVMIRGMAPLRVGLPIYFRRPEFVSLVEA